MLEVNLAGTFNATQVFGARDGEAGGGSIVNIGSLYASVAPDPALLRPPRATAVPQAARLRRSKAGVVNLTRYFARLWGPHGVRVNTLSPGGVRGGQDAEFVRKYSRARAARPHGRAGRPRGPLLFLASDASSYVTGHELRVDGGFTA